MKELIHKRKLDSKTFDTGRTQLNVDGVTEDPIYGTRVQNGLHAIESDGSLVDCDMGIEESTDGVTHLRAKKGRWGQMRFGDSSHPNSFLVKIKNKDLKGVSFKYTGANGSSMTANNGKPLCNFDNGISIESTPYYKGVKMDIIVNDPLTAPLEYHFSVKTYGQDYDFIEENGGATLRGEDQDPIFIKPPYAEDANGDIGPVTIHYTGMDGNLITFKKAIDEEWLRQAVAPVRIDPDVTIDDVSGTLEDTRIAHFTGLDDYNYGGATFLNFVNNAANDMQNDLLRVDLTAYSGIIVTSAKFGIDIYFKNTQNPALSIHRMLRAWGEGNRNGATATAGQSSWNDFFQPNAWATAGALSNGNDRQTSAESTTTITGVDSDFALDLTAASVQDDIDNPGNNHGYGVYNTNQVAGSNAKAYTSESGVGNIPYFYMEWIAGDGWVPFFFDGGHF